MEKKQGIFSIEVARDNFFYTTIMDGHTEAAYISLLTKKLNTESNTTTQIFNVKDKTKKPIYVLKTICFPEDDTDRVSQVKKEFELAERLGSAHKNIAKGIDLRELICESTYTIEMLMEYGGENLLELNLKKELTGIQLIRIAMQTASAMEFAHKQGVFHSDIKPENIVYKDGVAKIIDFGVSIDLQQKTKLKKYTDTISGNILGATIPYCPPEMFQIEKIKKIKKAMEDHGKLKEIDMEEQNEIFKKYGGFSREKIDVYLWGMTFYQLLAKKTLETLGTEREEYQKSQKNYGKFQQEIKKLKFDGEINEKASRKFIQVLEKCLNYSPPNRPTFDEINNDYMFEIKEFEYDESVEEVKTKPEAYSDSLGRTYQVIARDMFGQRKQLPIIITGKSKCEIIKVALQAHFGSCVRGFLIFGTPITEDKMEESLINFIPSFMVELDTLEIQVMSCYKGC